MMSIFQTCVFKKKTRHIPIPYITYYEYFNRFKVHIQKLLLIGKSKTLTFRVHNTFYLNELCKTIYIFIFIMKLTI